MDKIANQVYVVSLLEKLHISQHLYRFALTVLEDYPSLQGELEKLINEGVTCLRINYFSYHDRKDKPALVKWDSETAMLRINQ